MEQQWIQRWHYTIAARPVLPGVWRRKEGGYLIRGRAKDPRTSKTREVLRALDCDSPAAALAALHDELARIRRGATAPAPSKTRFATYAVSLLERKIVRGEIRSKATIERWNNTLEEHLIPHFGALFVDEIRRADVEAWKDQVAARLETRAGPRPPAPPRPKGATGRRRTAPRRDPAARFAPSTANGWLSILRVILTTYAEVHELERNPARGVEPFDARGHRTYTKEHPNALTVPQLRGFLEALFARAPQHYAMVLLGFATGLRPSSLRPLRHQGPESDVLWDEGELLVRRSHTRGQAVMDLTKTGKDQRIALPETVMAVLRWHVREQLPGLLAGKPPTDLLFPSDEGRLRSPTGLKRAFGEVARAAGLPVHVSPRAMRRTFQDLARSAEMRDVVTRSISGHATATMQQHYSTVWADEQRAGIAKVVDMAAVRARALAAGSGGQSGGQAGDAAAEGKSAGADGSP